VKSWYRCATFLGLTGAAVSVAGCGKVHMAAPEGYDTGMDRLTTVGRADTDDETGAGFKLGPYKIGDVKRNQSIQKGFDDIKDFKPAKKGGFRYELAGGADGKLDGQCMPRAIKKKSRLDGSIDVEDEKPTLGCTCALNGDTVAHLFVEDLAGEYGGPVIVGDVQARALGTYKLENGDELDELPAGYRIWDGHGAVAAAEVVTGEAHVWLKEGLLEPDRRRIVCVMAGLMLWERPDQPE